MAEQARGPERPQRAGTVRRRRAMLDAARELFVREGVDRTSMDAVAAKAGVSKATMYGYFGDKQRLFRAIIADASESLLVLATKTADEYLPMDGTVTTVAHLEEALTAAAVTFGRSVVAESEYAAVFALIAQRRWHDPESADDVTDQAIIAVFAGRFAHFAEVGLLDTSSPTRAAEHFFALTVLLAYNEQGNPATVDSNRVQRTMTDGVNAFIRAYGAR